MYMLCGYVSTVLIVAEFADLRRLRNALLNALSIHA